MTEEYRTSVYFADRDMSDVILVVGNKDFYVHKTVLAIRSKYFKALFYSDSAEKDQKEIEIDTDPVAFERMLELIYNGRLKHTKFLKCKKSVTNDFWNAANALWTAFDRFDCDYARDLFLELLESSICPPEMCHYTYNGGAAPVYRCYGCADRFIFAVKKDIEFPQCSSYSIIEWLRENRHLPPELEEMKQMFSVVQQGY